MSSFRRILDFSDGDLGQLVFQQMGQELTGTALSTVWWICVFTAKNSV